MSQETSDYIHQLELILEDILEEFEPALEPGQFEIYDATDCPVQVSESLAAAVLEAEKFLYGTDSEGEDD